MYTKRTYGTATLLNWTRRETMVFIVLATLPVVLYDVLEQRWLRLPWLPIALVGTAVAFILGFQNNASYGRLWEARKIWGGIVNTSRAWAMMVNDFITNDFVEDEAREADAGELRGIRRELILRHVAWLTALRHAMRQPRPWEHFLRHRTNREWSEAIQVPEHQRSLEDELQDYLSEEDCAAVSGKANLAAQLLALQSNRLGRLRTRGLIDDFRHMEMQQALTSLVDSQGKSERIKNFPYPRQYATLNATFVWIFVFLLPYGLVYEFDQIGNDLRPDYPLLGRYFVWLSVLFSVIVMWIFHTMERIGRVSENPFEGSPNDVPITTMSRAIEIDLREMIGDPPESIPAPIEPRHATQM